jgi:hypothetical protein
MTARLPSPGSDDGTWGDILNTFLEVSHNSDGTLKQSAVQQAGAASSSILVSAGTGLTGGGDLSANRTISANFGTSAGTIAQGNDARITGAVQSSLADAKGDLLVGSAADAIVRLPVGSDGQVLTADAAQASGVKWANAAGVGSATFPLSGYGLVAASDDPIAFGSVGNVSEGNVWLVRVWVPAGVAFGKIALAVSIGGAHSASSVPNQLGWYDDNGVLQEATPDDSTMWANSTSWYVRTLATPVAAQGTGRFIYVGFIVGGFSNVSPCWNVTNGNMLVSTMVGSSRRRAMFTSGQTALPSSFNPSSYGTQTGYIPLVGLAT